jgi:hypothetical protein
MKRLSLVFVIVIGVLAGCAPAPGPSQAVPSTATTQVGQAALTDHVVPAGSTASVDPASWSLADRLAAPAYTSDTTGALVAGLAQSGIGTYPDTASGTPEVGLGGTASPFRLLDFQAHALAVGAWAGDGLSGADLDTVIPLPAGQTGMPSTSDLLAAYVGSADSAGGSLSRALMAGQDLLHPATLRFPSVVLVLFASDLATDGGRLAPPTSPSAGPTGSASGLVPLVRLAVAHAGPVTAIVPADGGGVCSTVSNWADGMIHTLFNALKLATPANLPGAIVTGIWNWLVSAGEALVRGLIGQLTSLVLGQIRSVAAMISGVAEQVASLLPYAVNVRAAGPAGGGTIVLGSNPIRGTFTATISAGDLPDWPAVLSDCATTLAIALPNFHSNAVPITWSPIKPALDPLLGPIDADRTNDVTDTNGQAVWTFLTARDPGDPTGEELNQVDSMTVTAHRPELDTVRQRLTDALLGWVPTLLKPFVVGLFAPYLDGLQDRLNKLLDATGNGIVVLRYRGQASPRPSTAASPAASGQCATSLPAGTYQGTLTEDSTTIVPPGQVDLGESGGTNDHGTGPLTVTVAPDGSLGGTFSVTVLDHQVFQGLAQGTTDTTMLEQGAGVSGTLCNLVLTFASETATDCHATGHGTCGSTGITIPLAGLVPPLPIGAPSSVAPGSLTWSISAENGADAGFGGLSAEVQSTTTVTLSVP